MKIRIGIEGGRAAVLTQAQRLNAPILVSANSMWDNRQRRFSGWECYRPHDTALDSGGFIAMKLYGGYRWSVGQYVHLAKAMTPTWWAQMDFCCEPEIAADRRTIVERVRRTAHQLRECEATAHGEGVPPPMPVLQGWKPEDYCHGPIYNFNYRWPALVGIGSVCRRPVHGADGILAVAEALEPRVPRHVQFHFFGVKSQAIKALLQQFPHRCASMDSMAWNRAASWHAHKNHLPCSNELRAAHAARWYERQSQIVNRNS
jgi:hypothetical protein